MRLHHIAIGAQDVDALSAFYREIFTAQELKRYHLDNGELRSVWLDADGVILMFERQTLGRLVTDLLPDERLPGCFLLAFTHVVPKLELQQKLQTFGIKVSHRTDSTLYFSDIEGNRLAVSSYPKDLI